MVRILASALAGVTLAALVGCGGARVVQRSQSGGVLALEGDRNKAMEQAHQMMASHCHGPYQIVEEGEHVVGTDRIQSTESYVSEEGEVVEERGEATRDATEWRLRYVCGRGQAAPPGELDPDPPGGEDGPEEGPDGPPPDEGPDGEPGEGEPPPGEEPPAID